MECQDSPKLHHVSLGQNTLHRPSCKLAAVVLHLSGHNGTALRHQLAPPVKSATAALRLAVELVEGVHGEELVVAADNVLLDGVQLCPHHQVNGLLVVGGQVELAVLVGLGCWGLRLLGGVVEGVAVGHVDLLRLQYDLVGEVVVDVRGLLGEGGRLVDDVLGTLGCLERCVGGVLVDGDHVQGGVVALVQEDLVALLDNDNVPGVDGARGAHEHGQNGVGGEDPGLVLVGELLDDGVARGGDVVGGTVERAELLLGALDGLLVKGPVVVVEEAVAVDILALVGVQVQLAQAVVVNLLQHLPVGANVDTSIAVALRLVVVLPAEPPATAGTTAALVCASSTSTIITTGATTSTCACEGLAATTAGISSATTLATATGEDGATSETGLAGVAGVGDDREGCFVLLDYGGGEEGGTSCAICLLICR